jgi:hypothetical protein
MPLVGHVVRSRRTSRRRLPNRDTRTINERFGTGIGTVTIFQLPPSFSSVAGAPEN